MSEEKAHFNVIIDLDHELIEEIKLNKLAEQAAPTKEAVIAVTEERTKLNMSLNMSKELFGEIASGTDIKSMLREQEVRNQALREQQLLKEEEEARKGDTLLGGLMKTLGIS
jgi:hypothetical protein